MTANYGQSIVLQAKGLYFSRVSSKDYLDHVSRKEKPRYEEKLQILGTCDPYSALAALFKSLLELQDGDI